MTRRDYLILAAAIKNARDYAATHPAQHADVGVTITLTIATAIENNDPCFDKTRFLKNAGLSK